MATKYPAFYVSQVDTEDQGLPVGLAWLAKAAATYEGEAIVVVPGLNQLRFLPSHAFRAASGGSLRNSGWRSGPVLLVWPDDKLLQRLHDSHPTAMCIVPGYRGRHIQSWISATSAVDLSGVEQPSGLPGLGDPVAEVAFDHLTRSITLHTGLNSLFAKGHAVQTIELLRNGGHHFDTAALEAWAIAHGWRAEDAADLREVAEKIAEGRRYRVARDWFRPNVLDIWRKEAADKE
jgi:hypothetical protein